MVKMRLFVILFVLSFVLFVFAEAKSSSSRSSKPTKSSESKNSVKSGKVTKHKNKQSHTHYGDSSDSSEESSHKKGRLKKPTSGDLEKHKFEDGLFKKHEVHSNPTKRNESTRHHEADNGRNHTRHSSAMSRNDTSLINKNITSSHPSSKNTTKPMNNVTTPGLGWTFPRNSSVHKPNNVNNGNDTNFFLLNEKDSNSGLKKNSSVSSAFERFERNTNTTSQLLHDSKKNTTDQHAYGWMKNTKDQLPLGWKNHTTDQLPYGWKNNTTDQLAYGWNNNTASKDPPIYGYASKTNIPEQNMRKDFAPPELPGNQKNYFLNSGISSFNQFGPNSIPDNKHSSFPTAPNFQPKKVSNIAPEYGWNVQNPVPVNNYYNSIPEEKVFPIYNTYDDSKKGSKFLKGPKKALTKIAKSVGKGLSNDDVKDKLKEVASNYFSNPPPREWNYNPSYNADKLNYYGNLFGRFLPSGDVDKLSVSDWKNIIFGNSPLKVGTRPLYSASFPETDVNLNLSPFSGQGNFPDLGLMSYKKYFLPPYYQKLFAGLRNEDVVNDPLRVKRELSPKGKVIAAAVNKFLINERDCNETNLNAKRRKRQLIIKPLHRDGKNINNNNDEKQIKNFQFTDVEAIVLSGGEYSVYGGVPEEFPVEGTSSLGTERTAVPTEITIRQNSGTPSSTGTVSSNVWNRTRLYPVSESIAQFLKKKPATQLKVVKESLEQWKSTGKCNDCSSSLKSSIGLEPNEDENSSVPLIMYVRGSDSGVHSDKKIGPSYRQLSESGYGVSNSFDHSTKKSDVNSSYLAQRNNYSSEKFVSNHRDNKRKDVSVLSEDRSNRNNGWLSEMIGNTPEYNHNKQSKRKEILFFGVYIPSNTDVAYKRDSVESDSSYVSGKHSSDSNSEFSFTPEYNELTEDGPLTSMMSSGSTTTLQPTEAKNSGMNYNLEGDQLSETYSQPTIMNHQPMPGMSDLSDKSSFADSGGSFEDVPTTSRSALSYSYDGVFTMEPNKEPVDDSILVYRAPVRNRTEEPFKDGPVIISAPLRRIVCGPNQRIVKGRCRTVW